MPRNASEFMIVRDLSDGSYYLVDGDGLPVSGDYVNLADVRAALAEIIADDEAARRQEAE